MRSFLIGVAASLTLFACHSNNNSNKVERAKEAIPQLNQEKRTDTMKQDHTQAVTDTVFAPPQNAQKRGR